MQPQGSSFQDNTIISKKLAFTSLGRNYVSCNPTIFRLLSETVGASYCTLTLVYYSRDMLPENVDIYLLVFHSILASRGCGSLVLSLSNSESVYHVWEAAVCHVITGALWNLFFFTVVNIILNLYCWQRLSRTLFFSPVTMSVLKRIPNIYFIGKLRRVYKCECARGAQ